MDITTRDTGFFTETLETRDTELFRGHAARSWGAASATKSS